MSNIKVSENLKNNYQNYYQEGKSEWRRLGAIGKIDNIISLCDRYPHRRILEIGAGEGSILKRLSELEFGEQLFALEISNSGVEAIKNKNIDLLCECNLFDGYEVPYEDNTFDLVILSHVVEHLEFPRKLLYEARRVAKYVFIEVPLEDTLLLSSDYKFNEVGHINFYSPKTIRRLLQTCNLQILDQRVANLSKEIYLFQSPRLGTFKYLIKENLLNFLPWLSTYIFTYHFALICQKSDG
jgi:SAM-dependent methyltransferase